MQIILQGICNITTGTAIFPILQIIEYVPFESLERHLGTDGIIESLVYLLLYQKVSRLPYPRIIETWQLKTFFAFGQKPCFLQSAFVFVTGKGVFAAMAAVPVGNPKFFNVISNTSRTILEIVEIQAFCIEVLFKQ